MLLSQSAHIDELLHVCGVHGEQRVVGAFKQPGEASKGGREDTLHLASLGPAGGWRQTQAADVAAGSYTTRHDVLLVKHSSADLKHAVYHHCIF